eukprot:3878730-Rhodomonas_salina.1
MSASRSPPQGSVFGAHGAAAAHASSSSSSSSPLYGQQPAMTDALPSMPLPKTTGLASSPLDTSSMPPQPPLQVSQLLESLLGRRVGAWSVLEASRAVLWGGASGPAALGARPLGQPPSSLASFPFPRPHFLPATPLPRPAP